MGLPACSAPPIPMGIYGFFGPVGGFVKHLGRSFSQPISIGLPSKQSEGSSNQHVAEQPSKPRNDSSNPRAEQRNPMERLRDPTEELRKQGTHEPAKDPLHLPSGPITIARAKKFNEVIHMLIQQVKINYKRLSALNLPI